METLRNPGINFPVSGLVAVIATGMLLIFIAGLSRIKIDQGIQDKPQPVFISKTKPPEPIEPLEEEEIKPVKPDKPEILTNDKFRPAPIQQAAFGDRGVPGTIEIPVMKPEVNEQIPRINDYFRPDQVDRAPRILRHVSPVYPFNATVNGTEGRVVLRFIVDENGAVQSPEVVKADPEGVFEKSALAAIAKYKFDPAVLGGEKVKCIVVLPMGFKLN